MTSTTERANPLRQWNPDWGGGSTARRPVAAVNTLFLRRSDFVKPLHPQRTPLKIGVRLGDQHVRVPFFTGPAHLPAPPAAVRAAAPLRVAPIAKQELPDTDGRSRSSPHERTLRVRDGGPSSPGALTERREAASTEAVTPARTPALLL